ncbi:MAG: hypothetical protein V4794_15950 [Pseudomonadota bacterium]
MGYSENSAGGPNLALVNNSEAREVLAWVATYTPEAFPLSQVLRILPVEEYELLSSLTRKLSANTANTGTWASVVLGEIISQGDSFSYPDKAPISRSIACFSYAVARTSLLFRSDEEVFRTSIDRLHLLEKDKIFSGRKLGVHTLAPIWRVVQGNEWDQKNTHNTVRTIVAYAREGNIDRSPLPELEKLQIDVKKMSSGTIEQRVQEFENASVKLINSVGNQRLFDATPMYLAGFAFWVGGGTSHITLLEEFSDAFPSVYSWLGLFAGLAGRSTWDSKWLRGVSTVERALKMPFALSDPPISDLCWTEYELIAAQRLPMEWVKELPKLSPKTLSVEVLPGAVCQMRLTGADSELQDARRSVPLKQQGVWLSIEEFAKLKVASDVIQSILAKDGSSKQQSLFERSGGSKEENSSTLVSRSKKRTAKQQPKS